MKSSCLLLDAGNTRLKWALVEAGAWVDQGSATYADLSGLVPALQRATCCYVASVVRKQDRDRVEELVSRHVKDIVWLASEARFGDVRNAYAEPSQLGVDRWLGLIAARARSKDATLVVSVGTAMTVDALEASGGFSGGVIVPGVGLMRQALTQGTAGVAEVEGRCVAFPRSTADAVESGIMAALSGAVNRQYGRLRDVAGDAPRCIVTGGDAARLMPHLDMDVEHAPALVLEGMALVASEGYEG